MSYQTLIVAKKENYAVITFNRPDKFNAANAQLFADLAAAIRELDADKEVGCIVLTGQEFTHPKRGTPYHVFSAGADVEQFAHLAKVEAGYDFIKVCFEPFKAIENAETPVVAAVNGSAFGFGFEIQGPVAGRTDESGGGGADALDRFRAERNLFDEDTRSQILRHNRSP